MREEIFNMTQKEVTKLRVINQTIDSVITIREAAELLNLSERQVIRLKGGVLKEGPSFIIHKNRGRKPVHTLSDKEQVNIVELKKSKYQEANFAHFQELLMEHEKISLSYPSVYRILSKAGLKSPKKHRKLKVHHRRKRKPQEGMMVQIDASPHPWLIGESDFSLHGAIDDATGKILALFFRETECLEGYFQVMRQIIINHGIPISTYNDRHTIFISPKDGKIPIEEQLQGKQVNLTQFGRAMNELGINVIKAKSAQGKGRIERLWETLQSRLPVEFKINNINTLDAANAFLKQFIVSYNQRFAVKPADPVSAFRQLDQTIDLDAILCIQAERTIIDGNAFSYKGTYYQLVIKHKPKSVFKGKIIVLDSSSKGIRAIYNGEIYETMALDEKPQQKPIFKSKSSAKKANYTASDNHPWRKIPKEKPKLFYGEPDSEILAMLDELFSSSRAWA
jgi:transposase